MRRNSANRVGRASAITKLLSCVLCVGMLFSTTVFAENALVYEEEVYMEISGGAAHVSGTITLDDFIWADDNGRYSYSISDANAGRKYIIYVVKGIYDDISKVTIDTLDNNLLYINQVTAESSNVQFDFIPYVSANSTIIIGAEGADPYIAGYISRNLFRIGDYYADNQGAKNYDTVYTIPVGTSAEELKSILPTTGYAEIISEYADNQYAQVQFDWDIDEDYNGSIIGQTYRLSADITMTDAKYAGLFGNTVRSYVVSVIISDEVSDVAYISASKKITAYSVGDELKTDDIRVMAVYYDGTMKALAADEYDVDISGIDMAAAGTQTITITYAAETDKTASVAIYVRTSEESAATSLVKFDTKGGTYVADQMVANGESAARPADPVKTGYRFLGWYKDKGLSEDYSFDETVDRDITVYAGWESVASNNVTGIEIELLKDIFSDGEVLTEDMINVYANYSDGSKSGIDPEDYNSNYDSIDQSTEGIKQLKVTYRENGITYTAYADFTVLVENKINVSKVSFDTGCDEIIIKDVAVHNGNIFSAPNVDMTREGYVFAGWFKEDGKAWNFEKDKVTADVTLFAKWLVAYKTTDGSQIIAYSEEITEYEYTGANITPDPVILDENLRTLAKNKDYGLTYKNNKLLSTDTVKAQIIVTGKGNYSGTMTMTFDIVPRKLTEESTVVTLTRYNAYKASGYKISPKVTCNKKSLSVNKDYTFTVQRLSSEDAASGTRVNLPLTLPSWYLVTVTGTGNYTGSATCKMQIAANTLKDLKSASITQQSYAKSVVYTGNPVKVNKGVTVKFGSKSILTEGTDYELIYPEDITTIGKKTVTVRALPGSTLCFGEKTFTYEISGIAMSDTKAVLANTKYNIGDSSIKDAVSEVQYKIPAKNVQMVNTYTGKHYAKDQIFVLREGIDYDVSINNTYKPGSAQIVITGKGLFKDTLKKSVTISKIDLAKNPGVSFDIQNQVVMNKAGANAQAVVYYDGENGREVLAENRDYTVKYSNNKEISTAKKKGKITISGKGNYSGSKTIEYEIVPKRFDSPSIQISVTNPMATTNAKAVYKPTITITDNGTALQDKKDYKIDYNGTFTGADFMAGINDGYVTITAMGGYTGTIVKHYKVAIQDISKKECVATIDDCMYTGFPRTFDFGRKADRDMFNVAITYKDGNVIELVPGVDFKILSITNNINAGTGKVTIIGLGNYTGKKTVNFKIVKRAITR